MALDHYVTLGRSGLRVSPLCLGAMTFGEDLGWGSSVEESQQILDRYVALPPSPLEQREQLEQLRALEDGMRISCVRMEHGPFGVDTSEDLERARAILSHS